MSYNREVKQATLDLFAAADAGDVKAVEALVRDPNVDINWHRQQSYGATPLIAAISHGYKEIVDVLLEAGAELGELKTPDRNSPLHESAYRGEPQIMEKILRRIQQNNNQSTSALVDLQNQFGNTPLHNAARTGSEGCATLLLQAEAKPSIKNVNGSLPLHHACYCERPNLEVAKLLVEAGSDVNHQDDQGYTPLMIAAKKNQTEIIDYLRAHGADAKTKNQFGEDALHFATLRDNKDAMELLQQLID